MKKILAIALLSTAMAYAQETNEETPIITEFNNLIDKSNNFQEFKVVKEIDLKKLKLNTEAYIKSLDQRIATLEESVALEQEAQVPLTSQLNAANANVERLNNEKNSISVLGILIDKTVYNMIVWSIVAILTVALVIVFLQFKKSHVVTNQAKSDLATTEAELEELRRKSIEEKQLLGRKLQDERNKLSRLKTAN